MVLIGLEIWDEKFSNDDGGQAVRQRSLFFRKCGVFLARRPGSVRFPKGNFGGGKITH
jgi:hypothetical protein